MTTRFLSPIAPVRTLLILLAACAALVSCQYRSYRVPTTSMEPTIKADENIIARTTDKVNFYDVVVYTNPYPGNAHGDNEETKLVQRLCGMPGDTMELRNGLVYRNGKMSDNPKNLYPDTIQYYEEQLSQLFGNSFSAKWTPNDYGPIAIPAKGKTITITRDNLALYSDILLQFEGVQSIDPARLPFRHTFRNDYYFLLGDNRGRSLDSRYTGFVPHSHIYAVVDLD